jgi:hypothetical protein
MQKDDAVIARIRQARRQISGEHGHDPRKAVAYYTELQKRQRRPLLNSRLDEGQAPVSRG